ncbi:MAG: M20/M25/M40 family metallo-hydrolase, partial [Acidimicrobiales bacterium]
SVDRDPTGEVTELLQQLIRNACVNDGTASSGGEDRSARLLQDYFDGSGLAIETYQPEEGRTSLVGRIEGSDADAPSLMLMGHTDVVPVNPEGWQHDPFGAEVIDGEVWGRGAIDMLNLTASMAVATRDLAKSGWRPKGTLIYLAVADEEALGQWGAGWLTEHKRDAIGADYVLTESGGLPRQTPDGTRLPVVTAEKGCHWVRLTIRGIAGHGSQPLRTDNALVTGAEVVRRLAEYQPAARIHESWSRFVDGAGFPEEVAAALRDPNAVEGVVDALPAGLARQVHACTHTTFAPTVLHSGVKTNVIPDRASLEVDIRTLPDQSQTDVEAMLAEALGDLAPKVEIEVITHDASSSSAIDTPLWEVLQRVSAGLVADSALIPAMTPGATDARFFRRIGATAYGYGLFSPQMPAERYFAMFHADNERVDLESLRLSTAMWHGAATAFLG